MPDSKSLVFVVGAGASKEVDLPVGSELKGKIINTLDFETDAYYESSHRPLMVDATQEAILQSPSGDFKTEQILFSNARARICAGLPNSSSIDLFIESQGDDNRITTCGKLAIADCILSAERDSRLQHNAYGSIDFNSVTETWYSELFRVLFDGKRLEEIPSILSRIAFIVFNYDRCIEHFFQSALMNNYTLGHDQSIALMKNLDIYHPYGSIGKLWSPNGDGISFGAEIEPQQLLTVSRQIRTFSEGTDTVNSDIAKIRAALRNAKLLIFLGFAFNEQNIRLLYPEVQNLEHTERILATAHGISQKNIEHIQRELVKVGYFDRNLQINKDCKCSQLIADYSRSIASLN